MADNWLNYMFWIVLWSGLSLAGFRLIMHAVENTGWRPLLVGVTGGLLWCVVAANAIAWQSENSDEELEQPISVQLSPLCDLIIESGLPNVDLPEACR